MRADKSHEKLAGWAVPTISVQLAGGGAKQATRLNASWVKDVCHAIEESASDTAARQYNVGRGGWPVTQASKVCRSGLVGWLAGWFAVQSNGPAACASEWRLLN